MKYSIICEVYENLFGTTKRLEKTYFTAEFLKRIGSDESAAKDLDKIMLLLQGKIFPSHDDRKIGVAARLVLKALNLSTGISPEKIEAEWKKVGDLGMVAENLTRTKKQVTLSQTDLTISKVFSNLQKIATFEGAGTVDKKIQLIAELLTSAKPIEAKYITRTILEEMRVGLGEGTMRDAITWAYLAKPIGVFFQCKSCSAISPQNKQCLNCQEDLDLKIDLKNIEPNDIKNLKTIKFNFEDIEQNKNELHQYDAIITDNPRETYNYIISKIQDAYDVSNDFLLLFIAGRKEGISGIENIKMKIVK